MWLAFNQSKFNIFDIRSYNVVYLFIQFDGMSDNYKNILVYMNMSFTFLFTIECTLKLLGFGSVRLVWPATGCRYFTKNKFSNIVITMEIICFLADFSFRWSFVYSKFVCKITITNKTVFIYDYSVCLYIILTNIWKKHFFWNFELFPW
jgi:hypothetical protein